MEVVECATPVAALVIEIFAPGTAARDGSVSEPRTVAVNVCPSAAAENTTTEIVTNVINANKLRIRMVSLPGKALIFATPDRGAPHMG